MRSYLGALALVVVVASSALAVPPVPKYFKEAVGDGADAKGFVAAWDGLKGKCDLCHIPNADKKAKGHGLNDFGKAYHKHFDHKAFLAADKEKNAETAVKLLRTAWEKVQEDKNEAGETFGSLIQAGKLPGKNN
jgi:hypothetical protein